MKNEKTEKKNIVFIPSEWNLSWKYAAGEVGNKYIAELRDNARIFATRCIKCNRIFLPPQAYCERCFIWIKDNWVELQPKATLKAFTIVTEAFGGHKEPPFVMGYFKVDKADTNIPNFLENVDLSNIEEARKKIKVGMPIDMIFKEHRVGNEQDYYFRIRE